MRWPLAACRSPPAPQPSTNMQKEMVRQSGNYWQHDWEQKSIYIETAEDVGTYELPDKSILQKNKRVIGIGIPVSASGKKDSMGRTLLNATAYNSAHLVIKSDTSTERFSLRFEVCAYRSGGDNFFLRLPLNDVDIANSQVIIGNASDAVAGEVIQIDFFYERC